jgi:hypothetical protein
MNTGAQLPDDLDGDGCSDLGIASCFTCPLPVCRYDLPPKAAGAWLRVFQVRALAREGATVNEIAAALRMHRRTVFRLKRYDVAAALPVWER